MINTLNRHIKSDAHKQYNKLIKQNKSTEIYYKVLCTSPPNVIFNDKYKMLIYKINKMWFVFPKLESFRPEYRGNIFISKVH